MERPLQGLTWFVCLVGVVLTIGIIILLAVGCCVAYHRWKRKTGEVEDDDGGGDTAEISGVEIVG